MNLKQPSRSLPTISPVYPCLFRNQRLLPFILLFLIFGLCLHAPRLTASGIQTLIANFTNVRQSEQDLLDGNLYELPDTPTEAVVAFLQLSNNFTAEHRNLFDRYMSFQQEQSLPQSSWSRQRQLQEKWQSALATAGAEQPDLNIVKRVSQPIQVNQMSNFRVFSIQNCLEDAFDTAIATLESRRNLYGENSVEFRRWLEAQIQVFSHCPASNFNPPAPPGSGWQPLEIFDRQYQIAAAYFYDMQYLEAARLFEEIAGQDESPWSDISRYLVGRSLMQEDRYNNNESTELTSQATEIFTRLYNDPQFREQYPWIESKLSFAALTENQNRFMRSTADRILTSPGTVSVSDLDDFLDILNLRRGKGAASWGESEFEIWISLVLGAGNWSRSEVERLYEETRGLPWMYLMLKFDLYINEPELASSLISDFENLPASRFGYAATALDTAEVLISMDRQNDARTLLYALLDHPVSSTSIPFRNLVKNRLIPFATSQPEVIDLSMMDYESLYFFPDGYSSPLNEDWWIDSEIRNARFMSAGTASLISALYTPEMLLGVMADITDTGDNAYFSHRIAVGGWMRALFLEDREALMQFSRLLSHYYPDLEEDLERVMADESSQFDAAWIILNNPGMSPGIWPGLGRVQTGYSETGRWVIPARLHIGLSQTSENWWCTINSTDAGLEARRQTIASTPWLAIMSADQQEEMVHMYEKFPQGSAVTYLGSIVLDYARNNMGQDARIPQALHRLVFASRYACDHSGHGDISRTAYSLLHDNFPDSEWAEETTYWYD